MHSAAANQRIVMQRRLAGYNTLAVEVFDVAGAVGIHQALGVPFRRSQAVPLRLAGADAAGSKPTRSNRCPNSLSWNRSMRLAAALIPDPPGPPGFITKEPIRCAGSDAGRRSSPTLIVRSGVIQDPAAPQHTRTADQGQRKPSCPRGGGEGRADTPGQEPDRRTVPIPPRQRQRICAA